MRVVRKLRALFSVWPKSRGAHGDHGVVLVLWTLALTAIVGFLALTVDLGWRVQSDTNAQNAADTAALAALAVVSQGGTAVTTEAISVANHYGYGVDLDWNKCVAPHVHNL